MRAAALLVFVVLAACVPVSPELAAQQCEERARAAMGPTGEIGIGIGSEGASSRLSIGISSDYLRGRDPLEVYEECVFQKTGQGPIRPPDLE